MPNSAVFIPRPDLSSSENLKGLIHSARTELQVFGRDLNFEDDVWISPIIST